LFLVGYHPEEEFCDRTHGHIILVGRKRCERGNL
jgi:hypothetical protein